MSLTGTTSSQCDVEVMGAPLNPLVFAKLVSAEVDSSLFLPSSFRLVFRDSPDQVLTLAGLQLAVEVQINVVSGAVPTMLLNGEVTSVEVDYGPDGALTVVRGMDKSHRLMRGTKTMAYPMTTASEAVTRIVAAAGLLPGAVLPTTTLYQWLTQANVSDWTFIQQLAALENCVAYADQYGIFHFGPMPEPSAGLPPVMSALEPPEGTQLAMGVNLVRLRATVSSAEQVPAVTVTGYDPTMAMPVIGLSPGLPSTALSLDPAVLPVAVAGEFGAAPFFDASRPFDDMGAATTRAQSIAADIAGALAEMEGQCLGNADLLAGESFSIGLAGMPFDGQYIASSARHVFEPESGGYTTWFTVGGFQDRSLYSLASGTAPSSANRPMLEGLVVGTVVDNVDEESQGRVKVMFPWLAPDYVSAWARTVQIGAGKLGSGFLWLPEVGDEVLVGFDRGDIDHPYVLGNLYNGVAPPVPPPDIEGTVASRRIVSGRLHKIEFDDGPEALGITIVTGTQTCSVKLDAEQQSVTVTALGEVSVQAGPEGVSITSAGNLTLQAAGSVSIQGASISATAEGAASLQGANLSLTGEAAVSVTSPSISLGA